MSCKDISQNNDISSIQGFTSQQSPFTLQSANIRVSQKNTMASHELCSDLVV